MGLKCSKSATIPPRTPRRLAKTWTVDTSFSAKNSHSERRNVYTLAWCTVRLNRPSVYRDTRDEERTKLQGSENGRVPARAPKIASGFHLNTGFPRVAFARRIPHEHETYRAIHEGTGNRNRQAPRFVSHGIIDVPRMVNATIEGKTDLARVMQSHHQYLPVIVTALPASSRSPCATSTNFCENHDSCIFLTLQRWNRM